MDELDPAILKLAQERTAERYGIGAQLAPRLRAGQPPTLKALEQDAAQLRKDLGLPSLDAPERDEAGRFAGNPMNRIIREAAGRA
jgi:hypothetical protein